MLFNAEKWGGIAFDLSVTKTAQAFSWLADTVSGGKFSEKIKEMGKEWETLAESQAHAAISSKAWDEANKEAAQLIDAMKDPLEKVGQQWLDAQSLFAVGLIDEETLMRLGDKIDDELAKPFEKAAKEADDFASQFETTIEKAQDKVRQAEVLFEEGMILPETVFRAWDELDAAIQKADDDALKPFVQEFDRLADKAQHWIDAAMTPMQKYKSEVAEITDLWMQGFLNEDEMIASIGKAADELDAAKHKATHHDQHGEFQATNIGLQQGSKEELQLIVDSLTREKYSPQQEQAKATQQLVQHAATAAEELAQIKASVKNLKVFDFGAD